MEILNQLGSIAGIAGISVGVLVIIFREVIRKSIFPNLTREQGYKIIRLILLLTWSIAVIGIAAWLYSQPRVDKTPAEPVSEKVIPTLSTVSQPKSSREKKVLRVISTVADVQDKFPVLNITLKNDSVSKLYITGVRLIILDYKSKNNITRSPKKIIPSIYWDLDVPLMKGSFNFGSKYTIEADNDAFAIKIRLYHSEDQATYPIQELGEFKLKLTFITSDKLEANTDTITITAKSR